MLLSFVFVFTLLSNSTGVSAQTAIQYDNYINLFSGNDPAAGLKLIKLFSPKQGSTTEVEPNVQFDFTASFKTFDSDASNSKEIAWDHIRDFDNSDYVFILRICNTSGLGEGTCLFSIVPHKTYMQNDPDVQLNCTGNVCTVPDPLPKIYHYRDGGVLQNDKFHVLFNVKDLGLLKNNGTLDPVALADIFKIAEPTEYRADIWYCAGETSDTPPEPLPTNEPNANIRQFNNLCGDGRPYFKIAQSNTFKMPQNVTEALSQTFDTVDQVNTTPTTGSSSNLPNCHILNGAGPGEGSFVGCIAWLVYYGIYTPIKWFAGLLGMLFDFFLGYSLSDSSYRADFAIRGWQIVRDISNIFFIIILVWTGLSTVFGIAKRSMKQVVPHLILNALLINFSLFATRVVIDISNIVARVFYNSIHVCEGECKKDSKGNITNLKTGIGPEDYKPLSEKIVSSFNPQKIFSTETLNVEKASQGYNNGLAEGNITTDSDDGKTNPLNRNDYATYYIVVSIIGAIILFSVAMMFWKTAFFFLGRVIGLYVAMIFAPFAFVSREMPFIGGIKQISWEDWLGDLSKYAMLAPIFVFFLYIIYALIESDFIKVFVGRDTGGGFIETVIWISIPMLIVYSLVKQGVKLAENYAGEIGKRVQGFATGVVGATALGVASGGLASIARGTLGRASSALTNSNTLRKWSGSNNWIARQVGNAGVQLGEKGSKSSFDMRGSRLVKEMGIDTGKENKLITKMTRTTTDNTKGGVVGSIDRKEKRRYERMKSFQLSGDMAAAQDAKSKAWEKANIETDLNNWKAANAALANDSFSVEQERQRLIGVKSIPGNLRPETSKEINLQRNKDYADRVKKDSLVSKAAGKMFGIQGGVAGTAGAIGASAGMGILGGALSAVGGEMATSGVADTRVSGNIGRLNAHDAEITRLTALIAPLQQRLLTGQPTQLSKQEEEQLKNLKAKLKDEQTKRDALNERLTK